MKQLDEDRRYIIMANINNCTKQNSIYKLDLYDKIKYKLENLFEISREFFTSVLNEMKEKGIYRN